MPHTQQGILSHASQIERVESTKLEELMALDLEYLERLSGLCDIVLAKRKKPKMEEGHQLTLQSKPTYIKLNVGGTYFYTTENTLLREKDTFFYAMFGGKWEVKYDPRDDALFTDRDPAVFGLILEYLRVGEVDLSEIYLAQRFKLEREADFYQISSLMRLLNPAEFSRTANTVKLSDFNRIAINEAIGANSLVLGRTLFSPTFKEKSVKILKGQRMFIGIMCSNVPSYSSDFVKNGYFLSSHNGMLYRKTDKGTAYKNQPINPGSTVTVKLDTASNVSFVVDGEDWGIAFPKIASNYYESLHLAVIFSRDINSRGVVCEEGQVQILE